jgi:hypothetical protein
MVSLLGALCLRLCCALKLIAHWLCCILCLVYQSQPPSVGSEQLPKMKTVTLTDSASLSDSAYCQVKWRLLMHLHTSSSSPEATGHTSQLSSVCMQGDFPLNIASSVVGK